MDLRKRSRSKLGIGICRLETANSRRRLNKTLRHAGARRRGTWAMSAITLCWLGCIAIFLHLANVAPILDERE